MSTPPDAPGDAATVTGHPGADEPSSTIDRQVGANGASAAVGTDRPPPTVPQPIGVPGLVMIGLGTAGVVTGGLIAAVTGPLDLAHGSWLAAYLVLVVGVGQYLMGRAQTWRAATPIGPADAAHVTAWNLGNAAVIGGTLTGLPLIVDLGSALLVTSLAIAMHRARPSAVPPGRPILQWGYRIALIALAVSIPVGMLLSHLRHG